MKYYSALAVHNKPAKVHFFPYLRKSTDILSCVKTSPPQSVHEIYYRCPTTVQINPHRCIDSIPPLYRQRFDGLFSLLRWCSSVIQKVYGRRATVVFMLYRRADAIGTLYKLYKNSIVTA